MVEYHSTSFRDQSRLQQFVLKYIGIFLGYALYVGGKRDILDVLQECLDDYWDIDGDFNLSEPWTGFTQFTKSNKKPPDGYMWSEEQLTYVQATTRPDQLWSDMIVGPTPFSSCRSIDGLCSVSCALQPA